MPNKSNQSPIEIPAGFYSKEQVAEFLGWSLNTFKTYYCTQRSKMPPMIKKGKKFFIAIEDFNQWLGESQKPKRGRSCKA